MKAVFEHEHVIEGFAGPEETAILNAVANEIELDNDEVEGHSHSDIAKKWCQWRHSQGNVAKFRP